MKIAVNTRFLIKDKLEGIGVFTNEILSRLVKIMPENEFVFIFDRPFDQKFVFEKNVTPVSLFPPARHPFLWLIWYEWSLKRFLKKLKPDLFISMDGMIPLKSGIKTIAVIHDIGFEVFPHHVPILVRSYYRFFFPRFAQNADNIITVSEYSKKEISERYKMSEDKISVIYNACSEKFIPAEGMSQFAMNLKGGSEYFIYTGAIHPRKNIRVLLQAFDYFKTKSGLSHKLVIIGRKAWKNKELEKTFSQLKFKDDVIFTGRLPDEKMIEILQSALAMVNVSLYEGFGIPLLESISCGVPVICSNKTAFPEVAGRAGLYVDPVNPDEIGEKMIEFVQNKNIRQAQINACQAQSEKFSWDISANEFKAVLKITTRK